MKKAIKWVLITGGALFALVIVALLVIPLLVDVQKYKPEIEKKVAEATGRPFAIGGDLNLSLFPWAGISFSDLHLGNPPGFEEKDFLRVKSFEVRVKLIPLISKDIQVKRFILEGPRIVLEKLKDGQVNWEAIGKPSGKGPAKAPREGRKPSSAKPGEGFPIKALTVGEFAITKGSLLWIDHMKGERREISGVTFRLKDVSLDRPIQLAFSASMDGHPISLTGNVGPVGKEPGKGTMPLDLSLKALKQLEMDLKGKIIDPASHQEFDLAIGVSPFSPRKLVSALGQDFPVATADPEVLNTVAFKAKLKGNPKKVWVSDGTLNLDESKLSFSFKAKNFTKPDLAFDLNLDKIDLDRYLPPPSEEKPDEKKKKTEAPTPKRKKTNYTPLRNLVMDGTIRIGELKAHGARIQDLYLKVSGKNGRFHLDPLTLKLYQGTVSAKGALDVRRNIPKSDIGLRMTDVQAGPLLGDLLKKDFLEGTLKAQMAINMAGDDADRIKKTLNGRGDFFFKDGAIKGIDLAGMVRNVKAAFGLAERGSEKPRTDFSGLHSPFTITNGVAKTSGTSLASPFLRVLAAGKADLVKETLDFRVEPKFVGTLKGQGDTKQRGGFAVPVLVTGNFSSPKFRPDLKGMFQQRLKKGLAEPSELKEFLSGQSRERGEPKSMEEKAKEILKGLPFGR